MHKATLDFIDEILLDDPDDSFISSLLSHLEDFNIQDHTKTLDNLYSTLNDWMSQNMKFLTHRFDVTTLKVVVKDTRTGTYFLYRIFPNYPHEGADELYWSLSVDLDAQTADEFIIGLFM